MKKNIGIVNYGIGNHGSVINMVKNIDCNYTLVNNTKDIDCVDCLLLPGVGAFTIAIENIKKNDLFDGILKFANQGKLILGICLGMQLLADTSEEYTHNLGLGLIPGKVTSLPNKTPHIGWNNLIEMERNCKINYKINNKDFFYFNHSFYFKTEPKNIISQFCFNKNNFTAIVKNNNIIGLQFHPEISQKSGINLMKNIFLTYFKSTSQKINLNSYAYA